MTAAQRMDGMEAVLDEIRASQTRLLDMMESFNTRLQSVEQTGGRKLVEVEADDAQAGDYIGKNGFTIHDIDHGQWATIGMTLDWETFLASVKESGLARLG